MENLKKDIRFKWNVSIMVILILLACSLMWILTIIFLNSLISYTDDTYSYYKSYYVAKAWLELSLTEIDNSQVWFSQNIYSGNEININNFDCVDCYFVSHIQWRSPVISNSFWENGECNSGTALTLNAWESMVIPMFYDNTSEFSEILSDDFELVKLSDSTYRDNLKMTVVWSYPPSLNIWVVFQSWSIDWDISNEYIYMKLITASANFFSHYFSAFDLYSDYREVWNRNYYPYIVISNPNNYSVQFCVDGWGTPDKVYAWPTTKYYITSRWEYMGKVVWLQAIYMQPVPSFLINLYNY